MKCVMRTHLLIKQWQRQPNCLLNTFYNYTKSNICIQSRTIPKTGTEYATPSSAVICLANESNHVTLMQALYTQPTTKLRNILKRKPDVLFELLRSL